MIHSAPRDEEFWQAVLRRDSAYDDLFAYAVRSTGVFCRPSCPSRRTGRDQVSFFAEPTSAARGTEPTRRLHRNRVDRPPRHQPLRGRERASQASLDTEMHQVIAPAEAPL